MGIYPFAGWQDGDLAAGFVIECYAILEKQFDGNF